VGRERRGGGRSHTDDLDANNSLESNTPKRTCSSSLACVRERERLGKKKEKATEFDGRKKHTERRAAGHVRGGIIEDFSEGKGRGESGKRGPRQNRVGFSFETASRSRFAGEKKKPTGNQGKDYRKKTKGRGGEGIDKSQSP